MDSETDVIHIHSRTTDASQETVSADSNDVASEAYHALAERTPSRSTRASLMGSPSEVRNHILNYLLYWHEPLDYIHGDAMAKNNFKLYPRILGASRQLFTEGRDVLYLRNTMTIQLKYCYSNDPTNTELLRSMSTLGTNDYLFDGSGPQRSGPWLNFAKLSIEIKQDEGSCDEMRWVVASFVDILNLRKEEGPRKTLTINYEYAEFCKECHAGHPISCDCNITPEQRLEKWEKGNAFVIEPLTSLSNIEEVSIAGALNALDGKALRHKILCEEKESDWFGMYTLLYEYAAMFTQDRAIYCADFLDERQGVFRAMVKGYCEADIDDQSNEEIKHMQTYYDYPQDVPTWLANWIHCARVMLWRGDYARFLELRSKMVEHIDEVLEAAKATTFTWFPHSVGDGQSERVPEDDGKPRVARSRGDEEA